MTTVSAAEIFNTSPPVISKGATADFMITPKLHNDYFDNLLQIQPSHIEAVYVNGMPRYSDEKINEVLKLRHSFRIQGVKKYSTLDVFTLLKKLSERPGIGILQSNPIWNMLTVSWPLTKMGRAGNTRTVCKSDQHAHSGSSWTRSHVLN